MERPTKVTVTVKAFHFSGNTLLSDEKLAQAVSGYLNRPLDFNELKQAAAAIEAAYREAGWIVKAYLPKQEIADGIVTIQIIEAVFSGSKLESDAFSLIKPDQLLAYFDEQQKIGSPLNIGALDRALLLTNDLPGLTVTGALHEGQHQGETGLAIQASDTARIGGYGQLDNAGTRSTGANRAVVTAKLNSPRRMGDQLSAIAIHSAGSNYAALDYSVPAGHDGWRFGVGTAKLYYHLTGSDFEALQGKGSSTNVGLNGSYPIVRSRLRNLYFNVGYDHDTYNNEANALVQSDYTIISRTLGLTGNAFDRFWGGGANYAALAWINGTWNQKTLDVGETPALGGRFDRISYRASRQQVLRNNLFLYAALSGQFANRNLDSSQRFYLGGPYGVRAYPVNEGGGNRGLLANLELHRRLPHNIVVAGFYDWGHIGATESHAGYELKGYGLSVAWSTPYRIDLKAVVARRDGDNPNPTSTGRDQDGSLDRNRAWLTASYIF